MSSNPPSPPSVDPSKVFIPHGTRCEADDGRGSDFGRCSELARGIVTHEGRDRYVCGFHLKHYQPTPSVDPSEGTLSEQMAEAERLLQQITPGE